MRYKLCILLKFSILMVSNQLKCHTVMHNLHAIFAKFLDICKNFSYELVNEQGNIPRRGVIPSFSDIEVVSLALSAETIGIDSENYLFSKLTEYKSDFPNLISRRQYNDRRKLTVNLCTQIRERIAAAIDGGENVFCIDSKPIEICRPARSKRCKIGKNNNEKAPSYGYCASQGKYYYGYKLHAVCGISGVIHSFD
ncbi:MAG: transposase, partial [Dysgonomonas sp.]